MADVMNFGAPFSARTRAALPAEGQGLAEGWRGAMVFALFALVWVSTEPFRQVDLDAAVNAGNIVNQIVFTLAALMALATLMMADRRALAAYLRPSYLMTLAWLGLSVLVSIDFAISARAFAFTGVVLLLAMTALVLPVGQRQFALAIGSAAMLVVAVSYLGLVLLPDLGMHSTADIAEPEHAGSWRGLFSHKNIAGPMMVNFALIGLYVASVRSRALGLTLFVLATLFLYFTRAKTPMALFPLVLIFSALAVRIRGPILRGLLCLGPLAILLTFTVGSVLLTPVRELLHAISPGQTFTGRTEIWGFAFDRLAARPIFGFGFEAFWSSDMVRFAETAEGETGISQGMVHGHNSYVDVVLSLGVPGLLLVGLVLIVLPMVDYQRSRRFIENAALSRLYLQIWLFAVYDACLESFFFRRADPVWFTLVVAVFGLRLVSLWRAVR